jgi:hypothetical protein
MNTKHLGSALACVTVCFCSSAYGAELVQVLPLTDRILMLHFNARATPGREHKLAWKPRLKKSPLRNYWRTESRAKRPLHFR